MSIRFWVLSAALLADCAMPVAGARHATVPRITALSEAAQPDSPHRMRLATGGKRLEIPVTVNQADIGHQGIRDVAVLLQRGVLAIVTDAYGSHPQGLSRCQAGHETYARVIDVRAKRERYAKLVDSCLEPVEGGDPPAVSADRHSVFFELLTEPSVTITLNDNGTFTVKP